MKMQTIAAVIVLLGVCAVCWLMLRVHGGQNVDAIGDGDSAQQIKLYPGATPGKVIHKIDTRDYAFCEIAPVLGNGPDTMAQFYNSSGPDDHCPVEKMEAIDAKSLAAKLGATLVYLNPTPGSARHWVMDQLWIYKAGDSVDFLGVQATWVASVSLESLQGLAKPDYQPGQVHREAKYLYSKGTKVFLLRSADAKTWVMQSYATEVDKNLTLEKLPELGSKLMLPQGFKFETVTLTKDLIIDPRNAAGVAHILRDDHHDLYEGCGFDAACNYTP